MLFIALWNYANRPEEQGGIEAHIKEGRHNFPSRVPVYQQGARGARKLDLTNLSRFSVQ